MKKALKVILVTGGAGFVGTNLINFLLKKTTYKIISIDNYSSGSKKNHIKNKRVKYIKADTKNISQIIKSPKNINFVVVDVENGLQPNENTKKIIYESFKTKDNIAIGLENLSDKDRLGFYDSKNRKTILKFY